MIDTEPGHYIIVIYPADQIGHVVRLRGVLLESSGPNYSLGATEVPQPLAGRFR